MARCFVEALYNLTMSLDDFPVIFLLDIDALIMYLVLID